VFFYLPVFLLTISDTLAEWGGNKWGDQTISFFNKQKTLAGSMCFAVSALVICSLLLYCFMSLSSTQLLGYSFLLMFTTTIAELITLKGFDNITVPGAAVLLLYSIL
jgi:phytol kinase